MSELWWLQPGWRETRCMVCGSKIWPEGDPDWGKCFSCFTDELNERKRQEDEYARYLEQQAAEQR